MSRRVQIRTAPRPGPDMVHLFPGLKAEMHMLWKMAEQQPGESSSPGRAIDPSIIRIETHLSSQVEVKLKFKLL